MNRKEMIKHINTWFSTWFEVVEKFENKRTKGWTVEQLPKKGVVLIKHGELAITREDFKPVVETIEETITNSNIPKTYGRVDEFGRPSIKGGANFKRLVNEARNASGNGFITARKQALINGEEYYMLDSPCRNCRQIHERHVMFPCTNEKYNSRPKSKKKEKNTKNDVDMPKLNKSSTDFINSLNVKGSPDADTTNSVVNADEMLEFLDSYVAESGVDIKDTVKTTVDFYAELDGLINGDDYSFISQRKKKAFIDIVMGDL